MQYLALGGKMTTLSIYPPKLHLMIDSSLSLSRALSTVAWRGG